MDPFLPPKHPFLAARNGMMSTLVCPGIGLWKPSKIWTSMIAG